MLGSLICSFISISFLADMYMFIYFNKPGIRFTSQIHPICFSFSKTRKSRRILFTSFFDFLNCFGIFFYLIRMVRWVHPIIYHLLILQYYIYIYYNFKAYSMYALFSPETFHRFCLRASISAI